MKDFILQRPLFCACCFSTAVSLLVAIIGTAYAFVVFSVLVFLILLTLPIKSKLRLPSVVALTMALCTALTSYIYYDNRYDNIKSFSDRTVTAYATVLSVSGDDVVAYCKKSDDDEKMGFKVAFSYDKPLVPSSEIKAEFTFLTANKNDPFASNGIHTTVIAKDDIEMVSPHDEKSLIYVYYKIRQKIGSWFTLPSHDVSAFIKGMVIGDKNDIDQVFYNKFTTIGLSHVMSVSGMHLMFAVIFFDVLLAFFGMHYKPRSIISIVAALLFTFMSGFSVSCIRSLIMLTVYFWGRFTERISDGLTSLSLSAYIIVLFTPYNIGNISFILSVLATYGMIVLSPRLNALTTIKLKNHYLNAFVHILKNAITISLSANIACLPVMLIVFKEVSLIAPISNIILLVPIQAMFYLSFVYLILLPLPFASGWIYSVLACLYNIVQKMVDFVFGLKYITVNDGNAFFYIAFALLGVLIVGIVIYQKKHLSNKIYPYIAAYAVVCIVMFSVTYITTNDKVELRFVDVGHGCSSLITSDEHAVVVDCGGEYMGELFTALRHSNVKYIDLLAITHPDSDHINYIYYLINLYKVDKIIYPEFCDMNKLKDVLNLAQERNIEAVAISEDETFDVFENAKLKAFVKNAYNSKINSNTSALYKFEYGPTSACFTGDMSIYQEHAYIKYGQALDCDILLVPHHGSSKSCYRKILDLYTPEVSVISISKDNKFDLPDKRIVSRLEEYSSVISTADFSTIKFILDEKGYKTKIR